MQLYIFIIITVLLIVKPTVNALFLSQLGADNLPYGYLLVAVVAVITSYFYNKAIQKFSLLRVTSVSLVLFSLGFLGLAAILQYSFLTDWVLYIYYLGVSLFAVMATSQFWVLANLVFNAREAKRLFGFIGAGAIAGGVFGGYLTSLIGLDKKYLNKHGIDANDIAGLIPLTGHAITHFTVRSEMGIDPLKPVVDDLAPLYHVRADAPPILLLTGNRELELLGRFEENAYLMRMLKIAGHKEVEHMEFDGYGHGISIPAMPILLKKVNELTANIKSNQ